MRIPAPEAENRFSNRAASYHPRSVKRLSAPDTRPWRKANAQTATGTANTNTGSQNGHRGRILLDPYHLLPRDAPTQ